MDTVLLKASVVSFLTSVLAIFLLRPLAQRVGLVDRPNARKLHTGQVPLIGGIAIFLGFCAAIFTLDIDLAALRGLLLGTVTLILLGIIDDFHDIHAIPRLLGQLLAALLLITWSDIQIKYTGHLWLVDNIELYLWLAIPFTILLIMTHLNAINMIDGQDGLAASVTLGQAILLLILAYPLQLGLYVKLLVILIAALLAFLGFNMPLAYRKKQVFLGDSGSTLLGFLTIACAIAISQHNITRVQPITLLWIMAFPLLDLVSVVLHRLSQGKPITKGGRDHFHHILQLRGFSALSSTVLLTALSVGLGVIGILLNYWMLAQDIQCVLFLLVFILYHRTITLIRRRLIARQPS